MISLVGEISLLLSRLHTTIVWQKVPVVIANKLKMSIAFYLSKSVTKHVISNSPRPLIANTATYTGAIFLLSTICPSKMPKASPITIDVDIIFSEKDLAWSRPEGWERKNCEVYALIKTKLSMTPISLTKAPMKLTP